MNPGSELRVPAGVLAVLSLCSPVQPLLQRSGLAQVPYLPLTKPAGASSLGASPASTQLKPAAPPRGITALPTPDAKPQSYKLAPVLIPGMPGLTPKTKPVIPPSGVTASPTPDGKPPSHKPAPEPTPVTPEQAPKARGKQSPALLKPSLFCRSFTNPANQQKVVGFRTALTGSDQNSLVNQLSQQLRTYQQQGGNLSRCVYSGYLSPSLTATRLHGQVPTAAIRKADSYRMPIYGSYQQFLSANGGRAARFGLIASRPSLRTRTGSQMVTRITVNNALVFFVDSRNQQPFRLEPAGVSLRLMPLSRGVQQVLADAAKPSLQKLIDFKRLKKLNPGASPSSSRLPQSDVLWPRLMGGAVEVAVLPSATSVLIIPDALSHSVLWAHDPVAERLLSSLAASSLAAVQVAQVLPSAYCRVQSSFYPQAFCAELESGSVQDMAQCETVFTGRDRELTLCRLLFDEVFRIQGGSRAGGAGSTDPLAGSVDGSGIGVQSPDGATAEAGAEIVDPGDASADGGEAGFEEPGLSADDGSGNVTDIDAYDDPGQMIPDGMSPPVAAACDASNFGEQFLCLFMQALTGMLQQAFTGNSSQ